MKGFVLAVALLVMGSCAKEVEPTGNLIISGNVKGLKDGKLFIRKMVDTSLVAVDTIVISGDSSFRTGMDIASPEMFYLELDRGVTTSIDDRLPFFAEPGNIHIETTLEKFYADAKVTGSKNHDLFEQYNEVKARFAGQVLDLTKKELESALGKNASGEDLDAKYQAILKKKYLHAINFALNHRDQEIAPYIALTEINDASLKYLDTINNSLSPEIKKSKYGKVLEQFVEARRKAEK